MGETKQKISVFIITKDEEEKIERCLKSVAWADEIIVLDSYSTDKTESIAKKFTKKFYKKEFAGYGPQKQAAIDKCTNTWILEIDADELITKELEEEIQALLKNKQKLEQNSAYQITRTEYFMGKYLMSATIIRLYRKDKVRYAGIIHETVAVSGIIGRLKGKIEHEADKYDSIEERIEKNNRYTMLEAKKLYEEKGRRSILYLCCMMVLQPGVYFTWLYLRKGLIWKGYRGLIWCLITAQYHFLIYAKLYEHIYKAKYPSASQIYYEKTQNRIS
ncbi:glycosyltransferase family 2 protein [Candidatus Woesearchaeota archaeon]|nr:glycosyltransferase family 2 protein [Candidatus Woesearchaeota archaeon]